MSTHAQSIISSHKEAAKRATDYLVEARKLKLKPAEALELVARVLGVANWQTLNGLAKQGKAPRMNIVAGEPSEAVDERARRMADLYSMANGWKEHPFLLREDFVACDSGADDGFDYWRFVVRRLDEIKAIMPWDREALPDVQVARAGGIDIDFDFDGQNWGVASAEDDEFLDLEVHPSEADSWRVAAAAVGVVVGYHLNKDLPWANMALVEKLSAIREAMPWVANARKGVSTPVLVPPPSIARKVLLGAGFEVVTREGVAGEFLVKTLKAFEMPYVKEHIVSMNEVGHYDVVTLEIDPSRMIRMTIGEDYAEEAVSIDSDEGRGILRDAGLTV